MPLWVDKDGREYTGLNEENWSKAYNDLQIKRHKEAIPIDHPDSSVTDEKIGTRNIGGFSGLLSACFSWLWGVIEGIKGDIDAEVAERTAADLVLQGNIDTEVAERTAADVVLRSDIDTEVSARSAADSVLHGRVENEKAERIAADSALSESMGLHASDLNNPHEVTKEQVGLGNVLDIAQAAAVHGHSGVDLLDGSVTLSKLADDVPITPIDETFACDVFLNMHYIYSLLGASVWDGGYFFMPYYGTDLDGLGFEDDYTSVVDCGGFESTPIIPMDLDGGGFFPLEGGPEVIVDGGGFSPIDGIVGIFDGGRY